MKKFCFLLCFFLIVFSLALPAFAAEGDGTGEGSSEDPVILVPDVVIDNKIVLPDNDLGTYVGSKVDIFSSAYSGSNDLKSVLLRFLGSWDTVVVEHSYEDTDGSMNYVHDTIPDYPWLCAAGLLIVIVFCLFRLGGSILCKT